MRGFGFGPGSWLSAGSSGKLMDEGGQGSGSAGIGSQGYTDIASPPPPPPQVSQGDDWANPYAHAPPLVAAQPASQQFDWMGMGQRLTGGLVDIFGRPQQPLPVPQQQPGMPLWGWVAIGVGGVVVLGIAARSMRKTSYAGRRRSRR